MCENGMCDNDKCDNGMCVSARAPFTHDISNNSMYGDNTSAAGKNNTCPLNVGPRREEYHTQIYTHTHKYTHIHRSLQL